MTPQLTQLSEPSTAADLIAGGGEMGALVRAFDWRSTALGPIEHWPQSLRAVVRILLTSRFAMWMGWGKELTFLYNDAYARMTLGKKHPWALGRPSAEVWAEIWSDIGPRIDSVLAGGGATWDEQLMLFLERSGFPEETYHTFSYSPLTDDAGMIVGNLCVVTEETERVLGERRLASLRDLAAELMSTVTEQQVLDATARVVGANARDLPFTLIYLVDDSGAAVRLASRTGIAAGHPAAPEQIALGDPDGLWLEPAILSRNAPISFYGMEQRVGALPTGAWDRPPGQAVVLPITRPGQERAAGFLVVGVNPYRPLDQAYVGFLSLIAGQISSSLANARAHDEERRRAEALAELDRAKTTFFSNVSHELRTPLTLLLGPLDDVLRDDALPEATRDALRVAERNAMRLLRLVNSLLDFTRAEAGRVVAVYEPTDLSAYTAELASAFRSATERAGLALAVDAPSLGAPVYIDRDMWEKIILNLLSNAFKHTFDGTITVSVRDLENTVAVSVSDTGVGIAPDQLPRIFERFHRVANARSRTHEGTGIGLALVQELVRRHGGTIDVRSREGEGGGTTFTITIPHGTTHLPADRIGRPDHPLVREPASRLGGVAAYVEESARMLPTTTQPTGENPAGEKGSARILLADDNADMRDYVSRLLRERGWEVEAVADGEAALAAIHRRRPDLVLSDVMMPRLDGFGLLRTLRADPAIASVPVVLLSARAGEEARVEGAEAGADDYLIKPFGTQELLARVGAQLGLARDRARALAAVATAEERLRTLVSQAPVAIATTWGAEHAFEMANAFYRRIVFPATDQRVVLDRVYATGELASTTAVAAPVRRADGRLYDGFFDIIYQPMRDADGHVTGIAIVAAEVTAQVRARTDVERALEAAESASRAKGEFLTVMSHELRTPLNAIAGHVQLLSMEIHGPVSDAQRQALDRIDRSQRHLLGLVNDVLNLARIEGGHVDYALENVALTDVVTNLAPMIEPQLAANGLAYEVKLPATPVLVRVDRDKLTQILLNLLSNAVKFTPSGGCVTLDVAVLPEAPGHVTVRVADTGVGIPAEKQKEIFEPFVQVRSGRTRTVDGAGLGLTISRDLARGMGGDLGVESTDGAGSTFILRLVRAR
jgi:signal transduction histidine kinase